MKQKLEPIGPVSVVSYENESVDRSHPSDLALAADGVVRLVTSFYAHKYFAADYKITIDEISRRSKPRILEFLSPSLVEIDVLPIHENSTSTDAESIKFNMDEDGLLRPRGRRFTRIFNRGVGYMIINKPGPSPDHHEPEPGGGGIFTPVETASA